MTSPTLTLNHDIQLPQVGFGTYLIPPEQTAAAVSAALSAGYRHIDTAEMYRNEGGVGAAIRDSGVSRDDIFVTTKLWPGNPAWGMPAKTFDDTLASLDTSLEHLGLSAVDLYLIHAPLNAAERLDQWRALVELQRQGKARAIGVSNYSQAHIEEIRAAGLPLPAANQLELHPWSQKTNLVAYLRENGILPIAYSSLVPLSSWRTAEGHDSAKTEQMRADGASDASPFAQMAKNHGVSEAQVLLRWAVQKGYAVLPKSTNASRIQQNIDLFGFELSDADMSDIETMDRGDGIAWSVGDPTKTA